MQNFSVTGCTFENNQTNRGCLYPSRCGSVLVSDCLFESNTNDNFGGGMFSWQTTDLTIDNSIFRSNRSRQAGGMYYDARELVSGNPSFTITKSVSNSEPSFSFEIER